MMGRDDDPWRYVPSAMRRRYDTELVSIPNAVLWAAQRYGSDDAVIDGSVRLSFDGLSKAMLDAVRAVQHLGVGRGDRVALWAPNSLRWIVAALGVLGAGAVLVPVNTRFRGAEAAFVLRRSGASALVTVGDFLGQDYLGMLRAADPTSPALHSPVLLSGGADGPALDWDEIAADGRERPVADALAAIAAVGTEDLSDVMFTSGTTGRPKGVMLTHGQSLRAHGRLTKAMGFRRGDRYLIVPPFFHTFGYKAGWLAGIIHGVSTIPMAVFDAESAMKLIANERVSILCGPPTLFTDILDSADRSRYDLSSLRVTMPAAAHSPPGLIQRIRDVFDVEVIHSCFGLTEATSVVSSTIPGVDELADVVATVGRAVPDVELKVVDDSGEVVEAGEPGELWVRGYNVMRGYWDDAVATAEAITPDGWLRTGDVATLDERGYLRITDRKKDMIVTGGFNVYPAEVERILLAQPGIREAAVVGVPNHRLGEVPVAFLVADFGADRAEAEVSDWLRERLANFKSPRQVILRESLPRNASGKVLKDQLREAVTKFAPRA